MNIYVDGNFFYLGWVARFLGLPRKHPCSGALKNEEIRAFEDGWDTCEETPVHRRPNRLDAFEAERDRGNISVIWVDDDNNEIDLEGKLV